jgi:hypothetical protein
VLADEDSDQILLESSDDLGGEKPAMPQWATDTSLSLCGPSVTVYFEVQTGAAERLNSLWIYFRARR